MHYSVIFTFLCATLAIAKPLEKKAIIWDVVTEYTYVTVTEQADVGLPTEVAIPSTTQAQAHAHHHYQPATTPSTVAVVLTPDETPIPAAVDTPADNNTDDEPVATPAAVDVAESSAAPAETPAAPAETPAAPADTPAAPAETPAPSSAVTSNSVFSKAMEGHNSIRPEHSAVTFTWNETLAEFALQETSCSEFAHIMPDGADYGQNIYAAFSTSDEGFTVESAMGGATRDWYNEISLFNDWGIASPEIDEEWLHFTQMIWVASETVGCAVKTCGKDNTIKPDWYVWYVTCNYFPVGNVIGAFDKNVKQY